MRVLLVHNHYGSAAPSGENAVFELEREMLERRGHEVQTLERHSDDIRSKGKRGMVLGAIMTPWNPIAARRVRSAIARFQPDVMHAHNTFPLWSPAIFRAARGVGRVLTLHNYRLVCPAAIPMRNAEVCTECIDRRNPLPAVLHGCYRGSRMATLPLAANVALHRMLGTWRREVEVFIALSGFQRDLMAKAGLPFDRIMVKPNFYPGSPSPIEFEDRPAHVVFAGRLSAEKGVEDLLAAWLGWGSSAPELRLIGDGPLRGTLERRASGVSNIRFLGQLSSQDAQLEIASARLLVLPSRCFEGFPMVLREAFAFGTPTLVSDLGPLPEIVSPAQGAVFRAGNVNELRQLLDAVWKDKSKLASMSTESRATFERLYTEDTNYAQLMEIYETAAAKAAAFGEGATT